MEVSLVVPNGTDIGILLAEYSDIVLDYEYEGEGADYFIGQDEPMEEGDEWLTHDEAIEFCGFAEGAIPGASTMISGNGLWAQGLLSQRDFSSQNWEPEYLAERERHSAIWWEAHERGAAAREKAGQPC